MCAPRCDASRTGTPARCTARPRRCAWRSPRSPHGATHTLPSPFLVIATQNPLEHFGTYPLPESQMDRFLLRVRMGYPDSAAERRVVTARGGKDDVDELPPVVELADVLAIQNAAA